MQWGVFNKMIYRINKLAHGNHCQTVDQQAFDISSRTALTLSVLSIHQNNFSGLSLCSTLDNVSTNTDCDHISQRHIAS